MVFRYLVRVKRHLQRGQINAHMHEYLRNQDMNTATLVRLEHNLHA